LGALTYQDVVLKLAGVSGEHRAYVDHLTERYL
jgi:hypothetical protein